LRTSEASCHESIKLSSLRDIFEDRNREAQVSGTVFEQKQWARRTAFPRAPLAPLGALQSKRFHGVLYPFIFSKRLAAADAAANRALFACGQRRVHPFAPEAPAGRRQRWCGERRLWSAVVSTPLWMWKRAACRRRQFCSDALLPDQ
jgi:hypothetical protein